MVDELYKHWDNTHPQQKICTLSLISETEIPDRDWAAVALELSVF